MHLDRRIAFCAIGVLCIGVLAGAVFSGLVFIGQLRNAQSVAQTLQGINTLQSGKIAQLAAQIEASTAGLATRGRSEPRIDTPGTAINAVEHGSRELASSTNAVPSNHAAAPVVAAMAPSVSAASALTTQLAPVKASPPVTTRVPSASPKISTPPPKMAAQNSVKVPGELTATAAAIVKARQEGTDATGSKPTAPAPVPVIPTTPVMSVTLEQAGIAGLDGSSVRFKSGRQVSVGGEFPSGEKLISVSPQDGKIVTDKRVITLAKPQVEK